MRGRDRQGRPGVVNRRLTIVMTRMKSANSVYCQFLNYSKDLLARCHTIKRFTGRVLQPRVQHLLISPKGACEKGLPRSPDSRLRPLLVSRSRIQSNCWLYLPASQVYSSIRLSSSRTFDSFPGRIQKPSGIVRQKLAPVTVKTCCSTETWFSP